MSLFRKVSKKKRKGPAVSFAITTRVDETLGPTEVVVLGQRIDLAKVGDKVRVSGPRDSRTCPICIQYVGNVYKRGDPRIAMFGPGGDGAHPRDRHYLVPVGVPGLDEEIQEPGLDYVRKLVKDGKGDQLKALYGKTKSEMLIAGDVDVDGLYWMDGTVKTIPEVAMQGIRDIDAELRQAMPPLPRGEERGAVNDYFTPQYRAVNGYLRHGEYGLSEEFLGELAADVPVAGGSLFTGEKPSKAGWAKLMSRRLDAAIASRNLHRDITVHRGIYGQHAKTAWFNVEPGDTVTDKGYQSTTFRPDVAEYFASRAGQAVQSVVLEIRLKAGQPAIHLQGALNDPNVETAELILPRNTTLRVIEKRLEWKDRYRYQTDAPEAKEATKDTLLIIAEVVENGQVETPTKQAL